MSNHPTRSYPYDQSAPYSSGDIPPPSGYPYGNAYGRGSYDQQSYYPPASATTHASIDPRYRSSTPTAAHTYRYSRTGDDRYSQASGLPATTSPGYYDSYPQSSHSGGDRFIPTPSEIAHAQSYYSNQQTSQSPGMYSTPGHHQSSSRHNRHPSTSPVLSGRTSSSSRTQNSSSVSPTTERYPCEVCGKTFSRSHDRKRHHETQHNSSPVLHRCRYCRKEFSRADSLKRHLDNGCDEMPSSK